MSSTEKSDTPNFDDVDYGELGDRNIEKAKYYYQKAAQLNHEDAKRQLLDVDEDYSWLNSELDSDDP